MDDGSIYTRAIDIVRSQRPDDIGPLDDNATEADLPEDDVGFWDRVEAQYRALKRGLG